MKAVIFKIQGLVVGFSDQVDPTEKDKLVVGRIKLQNIEADKKFGGESDKAIVCKSYVKPKELGKVQTFTVKITGQADGKFAKLYYKIIGQD